MKNVVITAAAAASALTVNAARRQK